MNSSIKRRQFVNAAASLGALMLTRCAPTVPSQTPSPYLSAIAHLEPAQARLGVAIVDQQTGETLLHREHERFAMCSTFKLPLAALVLQSAELGKLRVDEALTFTSADLVPHAPVVEQHLAERHSNSGSMTIQELARAAQVTSDNVAANLLLRRLDGPARLTRFFRELGDSKSRLDDYEPMLNGTPVGALPNTTTPLGMAQMVARITSGGTLSQKSMATLKGWMVETTTGAQRLRAGFPADWDAGDKTGTNLGVGHATRYNDVACVWFPNRAPLVVACYLESTIETEHMSDEPQLILARVGAIAARWALANRRSPAT